jgi:hypothetical protein
MAQPPIALEPKSQEKKPHHGKIELLGGEVKKKTQTKTFTWFTVLVHYL